MTRTGSRSAQPPLRETVGEHMVGGVARARADETAAEVLQRLSREKPSSVELLCVVDESERLLGTLPLARLFALAPKAAVGKEMDRGFPAMHPGDDQEKAASVALHHGVDALPVVDADRRLLGVMPSQALLQVLRREHVEDLHLLAGIQRESSQARHAIEDPPMRRVRHRLPWLLAGLAGSAVATAAMAGFEQVLHKQIAVAFFVPALVYLADAIGTQSEAVAVRGLSLTRSGIAHLLLGELATGLLIGAFLAALSLPTIWIAFGDLALAAAVAAALFVAGGVATSVGLLFPWALAKLGRDPAYGSGPLATIIQDILTIVVYLGMVLAIGV